MKSRKILIFLFCSLVAISATLTAQGIFDAVKTGDLAKVKALVENDPGIVNAKIPGGQTILFAAVSFGRLEIAEYLISKGANVNEKASFHMTPLDVACVRNAPVAIVRLLVEKGADINFVSEYLGRPLDLALDTENVALIDYLKSRGAASTALEFKTYRLAGKVHRVAYPWGMRNNIVAFSGPDGILLVDTGFSKHSVNALRKTFGGLAKGEVRYIINTHLHGDHVDGNGIGLADTRVINLKSLENPDFKGLISRSDRPLRGRLGRELAAPYLMRLNGEEIQIISNPGLHSPDDLLIYFPKSKVLCMGDLLLSESCPAVQDVAGYMDFLDKVLDIFPAGTVFVSGHGKDLTKDGLEKYRNDLAGMIAVVRKEYQAGKSAEDMVRDDVLKAYKAEYSLLDWIGPDSWLQRIVEGLRAAGPAVPAVDTKEIQQILKETIDNRRTVGIVVGIVAADGMKTFSNGKTARDGRNVDGDSVFEIGSATKTFTATLLADMVKRGLVGLDDPASKYLPGSVKVPSRGGREITLLDLATQRSGLPRMPTNFKPADPENPYADYTVEKMYEFLSSYQLPRDIGTKYEYSNLGVGLLGHILARKAGQSYEALLAERIFRPLEMNSTAIVLTTDMSSRLAAGHSAGLTPEKNWDLGALAGAGAIRSTVDDMMKYVAAYMGLKPSPLSAAMEMAQQDRNDTTGRDLRIGLAWHLLKRPDSVIVWHNGGTGGYHSFVGFDRKRGVGVVVLSNSTNDIDDIGFHLVDPQIPLAKFEARKERKEDGTRRPKG